MATHAAVIATGIKQPLTVQQVPTPTPQQGEVQVRVSWVPSAPLDVFQVDAGLMAQFPQSLGDSAAGEVVAVGANVKNLKVGDQVFGFFFHNEKEKGKQVFITLPEHLLGKVPENITLPAAATVPTNFCTAFYTLSDKLNIELPWPRPESFASRDQDKPILIWGAGTSVGQYAVQILKHWGYTNVIATASPKQHDKIRGYGAKHVVDYRDPNVVEAILDTVNGNGDGPRPIAVFDCVTSKSDSLLPISKIATQEGSVVAAVLPVVIRGPSDPDGLELSADASKEAAWAPGVQVHSIVSYQYETNSFLRDHLQPDVMPSLLAQGAIEPNRQRLIDGSTLLDRACTALDIMRSGTVSGERLVWKVWTAEEFPETK